MLLVSFFSSHNLDFKQLNNLALDLSQNLGQVCDNLINSENICNNEFFLKNFFNEPYQLILQTPWLSKRLVIDNFKNIYCKQFIGRSIKRNLLFDFDQNMSNINVIKRIKEILILRPSFAENVFFLEYILNSLGFFYLNY